MLPQSSAVHTVALALHAHGSDLKSKLRWRATNKHHLKYDVAEERLSAAQRTRLEQPAGHPRRKLATNLAFNYSKTGVHRSPHIAVRQGVFITVTHSIKRTFKRKHKGAVSWAISFP